jgi:cysteinyl-tRNA synthetase
LQLRGIKMARRVGNIEKPAEVFEAGWTPTELRYALLATHYREPLDWGDETLEHARAAVERLAAAVAALEAYAEERADDPDLPAVLKSARDAFKLAMDDDLNVSGGLAAVMDLVRDLNRRVDARSMSSADAQRGLEALRDIDQVLGLLPQAQALPAGAAELLERRAAARAAKDWALSDQLRDELAGMGVEVEDSRDGQRAKLTSRVTNG